jgi:hypothetical protein
LLGKRAQVSLNFLSFAGAAYMRQLWLVVTFLVVMLLIGYGWQAGPGVDTAEGEATVSSAVSSRP